MDAVGMMNLTNLGMAIFFYAIIIVGIIIAFSFVKRLLKAHERIAIALEKIANKN